MALWSGFCFSGLYPQSGPLGTLPPGSGRPLWQRALTILPALTGFLVLDGTLAALTVANSLARMAAPDSVSKGVRVVNERTLVEADGVVAWAHLSHAHRVWTGRPIRSWRDLRDGRPRP